MTTKTLQTATLAVAATGTAVHAADQGAVDALIANLKNADADVRQKAWLGTGAVGAAAVKPLAKLMTADELEVARAAQRALWTLVRHVGRPGAYADKQAVAEELTVLVGNGRPAAVRREVLWMLSEIGGNEAVGAVAALLSSHELREDARMVLERIPGAQSLAALRSGLAAAPADFKPNLAQSLRVRGVEVSGVPSRKRVPTKKTSVEPVGR